MKTIPMVAKLGDQRIPVGTCNSAQARILVRDELASWEDGKLLLIIRKAHLELMESNDHLWSTPADKGMMSRNELHRRQAWFTQLVERSSKALVNTALNHGVVSETTVWSDTRSVWRTETSPDPVVYTSEQLEELGKDAYLFDEGPELPDITEKKAAVLWKSEPDVSQMFGSEPRMGYPVYYGKGEVAPDLEDQEATVIWTAPRPGVNIPDSEENP